MAWITTVMDISICKSQLTVSNVFVDFADNTRRPMNLCENLDLTTRFSYSNYITPQLVYFNANFYEVWGPVH